MKEKMMCDDTGLAEIKFKPVCSRCGKVLNTTVNYEYTPNPVAELKRIFSYDEVLEPAQCPYCHRYFTRIEMPVKLPYYPHPYNDQLANETTP